MFKLSMRFIFTVKFRLKVSMGCVLQLFAAGLEYVSMNIWILQFINACKFLKSKLGSFYITIETKN